MELSLLLLCAQEHEHVICAHKLCGQFPQNISKIKVIYQHIITHSVCSQLLILTLCNIMTEHICVCGKKFPRKYFLDRHLRGKTNKCKLGIKPNKDVNSSLNSKKKKETQAHSCKHCGQLFTRKFNKDRHEEIYCQKKDNIQSEDETSIEPQQNVERIISNSTKTAIQHLVYTCSKATNKNPADIILDYHLEPYFVDDLEQKTEKHEIQETQNNNLDNNLNTNLIKIENVNNDVDNVEEGKNNFNSNFKNFKKNKNEKNSLRLFDDLEEENPFFLSKLKEVRLQSTETPDSYSNTSNSSSIITNSNNTTNNNNTNNDNSTTSNTNNTNNNTNNGTIINNNNNISIGTLNNNSNNNTSMDKTKDDIPFVYPFGYENINFLKQEEMLEILKSVRGSQAVVDKIYSHISNQNFINQNQKRFMITVIDKDNKTNPIVRYYKLEDFGLKLYQNSIELLMRIYHKCHTRLSVEHQLIILSNIKHIEEQLLNSTQHYDNYDTIITGISNNGMKRRNFIELKKQLEENNPETTRKIKEILEQQFEELAKYHEELTKRALTKEEIHKLVWEPAEDIPEMDLYHHANDLRLHRVIETPRYLKRRELEHAETDLVEQNGGYMGDVETVYNLRQSRSHDEATLLKESYDLQPEHIEEINEVFSNKPNNLLKLQTIRLARNRNRKPLPLPSSVMRSIDYGNSIMPGVGVYELKSIY